ncbi:PilC/PilY family type IV pilus protein [Variovorax terrae]|uniref:PilY1 beta-propeller domain-containing protein n=1 Tax=Variovorax terrae TaxID=2923278 RepID=A0A9X1VS61_9BURK|nr:PilC/PilY family type IV pilus protein [Variovorax terrae]MCJ0762806.1 hypothetical protein [Variovorax terrae]
MRKLIHNPRVWISGALVGLGILIGYHVVAQSTGTPTIDFDNGPLVSTKQPANVVLALSVEYPTSGGAYKDAAYDSSKEYIGYFNSQRCYDYPGYGTVRTSANFSAGTDFFTPTGDADGSHRCNMGSAGTGFSGNYLNYATMSAPDILRLALTGGDRGIDEQTRTVLDRGTTAAPWRRALNAADVASATPFSNNASVYAYNCNDQVVFTTNSGKGCDAPSLTDTTDLRPIVASSTTASGTTTATPTFPPMQSIGTTWTDTGAYTTTVPTMGPSTLVTLYTQTFSAGKAVLSLTIPPLGPLENGGTTDQGVKSTTYVLNGTATSAAPTSYGTDKDRTIQGYYWTGQTTTTTPIAAAESPAVIRGYVPDGTTSTVVPPAAAESPAVIRGYVVTGTTTTAPTAAEIAANEPGGPIIRGYLWTASGLYSRDYQGNGAPNTTTTAPYGTGTGNRYVCTDTASPRIIRFSSTTGSNSTTSAGSSSNITTKFCTDQGLSWANLNSTALKTVYINYSQGAPYYNDYTPFYRDYVPYYRTYAPYYKNYDQQLWYLTYSSYQKYKIYIEQAVWNVYTQTGRAVVKPRALVCDDIEGPSRLVTYGSGTSDSYNYCTKYVFNGTVGYKPEGQVQQKSESLRVSVFSYLMDNSGTRYGGVLRAPMKYVGPNRYTTAGVLESNPEREWNPATGVFITKPINDSVSTSYTYTGVINYLNRFGKSGTYKTIDPTGELWYESLRYLQGLPPTVSATASITEAMKDGYPVYTSWTDPLTSACQINNYIMGIGDTNTHYARSMPGVTRAEQTTMFNEGSTPFDFAYPTANTINGSTTGVNAHTWTQVIDSFERNNAGKVYTDPRGNSRAANGNPAPNSALGNLDTTATGSGSHDSYHWAGMSYWANTQVIRQDVLGGITTDKVRVKTFMIDVDENNRGSIDSNIKATSYYLAGKYGYFTDSEQDGSPFSGSSASSKWADSSGAPKGYVLASQPQRLVAGIKQFFDDSSRTGSSFATVATSSDQLKATDPQGNQFAPSFVPGEWSGTVKKLGISLNTTTFAIAGDPTVVWDAGAILTSASRDTGVVAAPKVKPADRNIIAYLQGTSESLSSAATFTYAGMGNGASLPASFNQVPYTTPSVTDSLGQVRLDYLRGDRTKELDDTFRSRVSVMGDIINSGPQYKAGANPTITSDDYTAYFNAKKSRTPVIYTGANDGMLHAFRADNGQELFAYIPGPVLPRLPRLTSKGYIHELFVDAVPVIDEAKTSTGWKTILASGMGGGAQGVFALDVSDPLNFTKEKVLFEFTDKDDPAMGNVLSSPKFVKMRVAGSSPASYKYYLMVSSGYNNYKNDGAGRYTTSSDQAVFFLDLNKAPGANWSENSNYFKVVLPAASSTVANGLGGVGAYYGSAQEAVEFFVGDLQGNVWKIAFPDGISSSKISSAVYTNNASVKKPLFTARDGTTGTAAAQPITTAPVVSAYPGGGKMVVFGTGRLLEAPDRSSTSQQTIYGVWDSGLTTAAGYNLTRADLSANAYITATQSVTVSTQTYSVATGAKRGWYMDLKYSSERIVISPPLSSGIAYFTSSIPPASQCTDNGVSYHYPLATSNGAKIGNILGGDAYYGRAVPLDIDTSTTTLSSYSDRNVSGRRVATKKAGVIVPGQDGKLISSTVDVQYLTAGRVYWREVRDIYSVSTNR